jgi:hypothetical protein
VEKFVLYIFFQNFELLIETWVKLARQYRTNDDIGGVEYHAEEW